jgi:hypothetical protein
VSLWVHASPSLQAVPFAAVGFEQAPVAGSQVPATWHWSEAEQTTGFAPAQAPAWQVSVWVHASLSLHAVPSAAAAFEQAPVAGSQVPATWHWSDAVQVTELEPVHVPDWQVSVCVHRLLSSHAEPSAFAGLEHVPVAGSQTPATWHWSDAVQVIGLEPVHVPAWQVSVCVHELPSSHAEPSAFAGLEQAPVDGSQVPAKWH